MSYILSIFLYCFATKRAGLMPSASCYLSIFLYCFKGVNKKAVKLDENTFNFSLLFLCQKIYKPKNTYLLSIFLYCFVSTTGWDSNLATLLSIFLYCFWSASIILIVCETLFSFNFSLLFLERRRINYCNILINLSIFLYCFAQLSYLIVNAGLGAFQFFSIVSIYV